MNQRWIILLVLLAIFTAGCGSFETPAASPAEIPELQETFTPRSATPTQIINPFPTEPSGANQMPSTPPPANKFVELAKKDLASSLRIESLEKINLLEIIEIVWPDAALGCPAPGKVYAQGRVPGYKIRLEASGKEYVYHTDLTGQVILCPDPYLDLDNLDSFPPTLPGPTQDPNTGVPIR